MERLTNRPTVEQKNADADTQAGLARLNNTLKGLYGTSFRGNRAAVEAEVENFSVSQFLGDNFERLWDGTGYGLTSAMDATAPDKLRLAGRPFSSFDNASIINDGQWTIVTKEYQSDEMIGGEYPLFRVSINVKRTNSGRVKAQIRKTGLLKSGIE